MLLEVLFLNKVSLFLEGDIEVLNNNGEALFFPLEIEIEIFRLKTFPFGLLTEV
jgi:hypothetical protein